MMDIFEAKAAVEGALGHEGYHVNIEGPEQLRLMSTTWSSGRGEGPDDVSVRTLLAVADALALASGRNYQGRDELVVSLPVAKFVAFLDFVTEFDPENWHKGDDRT
jgi:hypothetical protein